MWWEIERILTEKGEKAPRYLLLENVDRLLKSPASQRGRDFAIILASLSDLDYAVEWRVINAGDYGMPQRRRRIFILGYRKGTPEYTRLKSRSFEGQWAESGVFADAFPMHPISVRQIRTEELFGDLAQLSSEFNSVKKKASSPFETSGAMLNRVFWTAKAQPAYDEVGETLGDVLQPLNHVPNEFFVKQEDLHKWKACKGAKREIKINKTHGYEYIYSEGDMIWPDPLDKPSRTIITGEGGASATRTKHIIEQKKGVYRRLMPLELERLNMFPDNHTKIENLSNGRRAFFMGNALVIGVVERIGNALLESINNENNSVIGVRRKEMA